MTITAPSRLIKADARSDEPLRRRAESIGDLIESDGVFVDGDWVESKDQDPNGDVRLIQLADVGDGVYRNKSARFLTSAQAKELGCTLLKPGDVLIARMPDPLGRACIFPGDDKPSVTVVDVCIVRTGTRGANHRWLMHRINSAEIRSAIAGLQSGSTRRRISRSNLARIKFSVPALDEQERIVAAIEKQFTRLDAGVASLKRVQTALKHYRASMLKAACEGSLVPTEAKLARKENRSYETGEELLQRILKERREKWNGKGKYKEPVAPNITALPKPAEGWTWSSLDQLSSHLTSGSRDWSRFYGKGDGTFILAQNVRPMRLDLSDRQAVAAPKGDAETERTRVRADDLLITIVGAKTGDVCRVPRELRDYFVCQSVALLRPLTSASSRFVEMYLASEENGQRQWKRYIYGQGRPHLSFDQLRMTAVALPPVTEQERIVTEAERRLSVIEELQAGRIDRTSACCSTSAVSIVSSIQRSLLVICMKPSIFIGSSSEALPIAQAIRDELAKKFLPDLWSDNLFELGEDTLTNLLRFVQCYDFAVLVISDDDVTTSRKSTQASPRDNVILELGLFLGALGRRRAFVVVVRTDDGPPKMPSDLLGNNGVFLPKNLHKPIDTAQLSKELKQLVDTIEARNQESILQLLPSTGLAIGYFENFVLPVCRELLAQNTVKVGSSEIDLAKTKFCFRIVLPKSLSDASIEGAKKFCSEKGVQDYQLNATRQQQTSTRIKALAVNVKPARRGRFKPLAARTMNLG